MARAELALAAATILDVPPVQAPSIAAAAGFRLLGVRLDQTATGPRQVQDLNAALADVGVSVLDVEVLRLQPDDPEDDWHLRLLHMAAEIGARHCWR
jgi:hypothetical protein